jgi:hypothetical protein
MRRIFLTAALALACLGAQLWATPIELAPNYTVGPTFPGKWGSPVIGTGATVTWSLMATGVDNSADGGGTITALGDFLPSGYLTVIESAFAAWAAVADLTFIQVADDGAAVNGVTTSGDIRIGGHAFDGANGTLAHGFYPPANGASIAGDLHLDTAETWKIGFGGPGFDLFQVLTHELGHALGLDHSEVPDSLMNPFYTETFSGPQADDIAGMQFLYGAAVNEVPEPGTYFLIGSGLALLAWRRRPVS